MKRKKLEEEGDLLIGGDKLHNEREEDGNEIVYESHEENLRENHEQEDFDDDTQVPKGHGSDDQDLDDDEEDTEIELSDGEHPKSTKNVNTQKVNEMGAKIKQSLQTLQSTNIIPNRKNGKAVNARRKLFGKRNLNTITLV